MNEEQQQRPTVAEMMARVVMDVPAYLRPAVAAPLRALARDLDELIGDMESRITQLEIAMIEEREIQYIERGEHAKAD